MAEIKLTEIIKEMQKTGNKKFNGVAEKFLIENRHYNIKVQIEEVEK